MIENKIKLFNTKKIKSLPIFSKMIEKRVKIRMVSVSRALMAAVFENTQRNATV